MKQYFAEERDRWECEKGEKVSKKNFLAAYGAAHTCAFTPWNITAAFQKTGVWPFSREMVTPEMMAPSKETAREGSLPLVPETPVCIVAKLIREAAKPVEEETSAGSQNSMLTTATSIETALTELENTTTCFLVTSSPIESSSQLPMLPVAQISPIKARHPDLVNVPPATEREEHLQQALREAEIREANLKGRIQGLQAAVVLQDVYVGRVKNQLAAKEKKKKKKGKGGKLVGDGLPKLLTGDEFFQQVEEHLQGQADAEAKKIDQKQRKEAYKRAMEAWTIGEEGRKARIDKKREEWQAAVAEWEEQRVLAKSEGRKFGEKRPTLGLLEKAATKPRYRAVVDVVDPGDSSSETDEAEEDEGEED